MIRVLPVLVVCSLGAQETTPSFRAEVNLANVSFVARDAKGHVVTDLGRDEIEVWEDGVEQRVSFFARSADLPLALGIVMDASGSQEEFTRRHRADIQTFLRTVLRAEDRAFLIAFGNRLRVVAEPTASAGQIMDALAAFQKGSRGFPEIGPREMRFGGTAFYDAIYHAIADRMDAIEGPRKALIVFSDGEDNSSAHHMLDAIETAQASDVTFFGIRYTEPRDGRLTARNKYGTRVMHRIAQETGGDDFDASEGDLKSAFRAIAEHLRSSYELGYNAANGARDGRFRKVELRSKRAGVALRHKTGYFAR